jgi:hypothetical protein
MPSVLGERPEHSISQLIDVNEFEVNNYVFGVLDCDIRAPILISQSLATRESGL